jgi:hypothetical protein
MSDSDGDQDQTRESSYYFAADITELYYFQAVLCVRPPKKNIYTL